MRKLATIGVIKEVRPIKRADRIELVVIKGWKCVVKKGEFQVGDKCVYFEVDSFLPIQDRFEFLRASSFKKMLDKEGFRLRTMRMKKQLSQGLALPMKDFPELEEDIKEGEDVTVALDVVVWEAPVPAELNGVAKGDMPVFLRKTGQERVQNIFDTVRDKHRNAPCEVSVKIDGTSCTYFVVDTDKYECRVSKQGAEVVDCQYGGHAGHNWESVDTDTTPWKIGRPILEAMRAHKRENFAIQGELFGEGINGNNEKIRGQKFLAFNVFDIDKQEYLPSAERLALCKELGVEHVPVMGGMHSLSEFETIEDVLKFAEGHSWNPERKREGVVFKSIAASGFHFKVLSNKYLLQS